MAGIKRGCLRGKNMSIARVFPTRTNMTPTDQDAYFSYPGLFTPVYDEVHISTIFIWDKVDAKRLVTAWANHGETIRIGGCAFDDPGGEFVPGMYLKKGITITSRGCPFNCWFCYVPRREGKIRELEIKEGNIIQDSNFLACSKGHRQQVYEMLKKQRAIEFKGGLDLRLLTDWDIEQLRGLKIKELWFACDSKEALKPLRKIADKLRLFTRDQKHCYVLIGWDRQEEEMRLNAVLEFGFMPFAQLYKDESEKKYSREWKEFATHWSRPAFYMGNIR